MIATGLEPWVFQATSCTVNPFTSSGLTWVGDCQPVRLVPSEIVVPPIATSSTQKPAGVFGSVPCADGSLIVRKESRTVWPAYAARLQVSAFQPPESPLKPGRFATTAGMAPGL